MKFVTRLAVLCYVTLILFLASFLLLFSVHAISLHSVQSVIGRFYLDEQLRMGVLVASGVLFIVNFIFYQLFSVNVHRDKIIAFDNPSGRVTVSLFALEDLVKRMIAKQSEVSDAKSVITAIRKGLDVKIKLALHDETNIPDLTSRLQEEIKKKIQDVIGLDEPVHINIYVGKILFHSGKKKSTNVMDDAEKLGPNIPFRGYRA